MRWAPFIRRLFPIPSFLRRAPVDPIYIQPKTYSAVMTDGCAIGGSADVQLMEFLMGNTKALEPLYWPLPTPRHFRPHIKMAIGGTFKTGFASPARASFAIGGQFISGFRYVQPFTAKIGIASKSITMDAEEYQRMKRRQKDEDELLLLGVL